MDEAMLARPAAFEEGRERLSKWNPPGKPAYAVRRRTRSGTVYIRDGLGRAAGWRVLFKGCQGYRPRESAAPCRGLAQIGSGRVSHFSSFLPCRACGRDSWHAKGTENAG